MFKECKSIIQLSTLSLFVLSILFGCSSGNENSSSSSTQKTERTDSKLYKLAHMNGCIDCHRIKATVVGPSWQAIADRYKDMPTNLAQKYLFEQTKFGSKGQWITWKGGDGMPPMNKRVSDEHIQELVNYIISLNRGDDQGDNRGDATPSP